MKSYKQNTRTNGRLKINQTKQGEPIELKVERIVTKKEPIKDGAPLLYGERKDGVKPETNVRTDRFDVAVTAMDKVTRSVQGRREEKAKAAKVVPLKTEGNETGDQGKGGETPK